MIKYSPGEIYAIKAMIKKGYQTRTIAATMGWDVLELHHFIKQLVKDEPEAAPPRKEKKGIPHYNDPRAGEVGSRLLLEALHRYYAKREGVASDI